MWKKCIIFVSDMPFAFGNAVALMPLGDIESDACLRSPHHNQEVAPGTPVQQFAEHGINIWDYYYYFWSSHCWYRFCAPRWSQC